MDEKKLRQLIKKLDALDHVQNGDSPEASTTQLLGVFHEIEKLKLSNGYMQSGPGNDHQKQQFQQAVWTLLEDLAGAANALQNRQIKLEERNQQLLNELATRKQVESHGSEQFKVVEVLNDAALALSSQLVFDDVLDMMLEKIGEVIPFDAAVIMTVEGNFAYPIRAKNYQKLAAGLDRQVSQAIFQIDKTANLRQMYETHQPHVIPDVDLDPYWDRSITHSPLRSWVGTPIIGQGEVMAFFSLDKLEPGFYNHEHAKTLEMFAGHAALALVNARLFQDIQRKAITDSLTGLYNRRYFTERAEIEYERALRYNHDLAMIMLDLDHFKEINDTYGHMNGDRVLQASANLIRQQLRNFDIPARYGGEEFIVLLPETDISTAFQVANRLKNSLADHVNLLNEAKVSITASFGVSGFSSKTIGNVTRDRGIEELINWADQALYAAKISGRNSIRIHYPSDGK